MKKLELSTEKAIAVLEKSIKLNPGNHQLYINLGTIFIESKMYPEAMQSFQQAFRLKPTDVRISNNVGLVQKKMFNYKEAIGAFRYSLSIDPENKYALRHLGSLLIMTNSFNDGLKLIYKGSGRVKIGKNLKIFK